MKILGIDPGLRQTGWAIIEVAGQNFTQIATGTIKTTSSHSLANRLVVIFDALQNVVERFSPLEAAVEETFVNMDASATLKLGQARAMALLVPARAGLPVAEYAPNQVKKTVVGAGHADKAQVEYMIKLQVKGFYSDSADATDALAIALCHAFLRKRTAA